MSGSFNLASPRADGVPLLWVLPQHTSHQPPSCSSLVCGMTFICADWLKQPSGSQVPTPLGSGSLERQKPPVALQVEAATENRKSHLTMMESDRNGFVLFFRRETLFCLSREQWSCTDVKRQKFLLSSPPCRQVPSNYTLSLSLYTLLLPLYTYTHLLHRKFCVMSFWRHLYFSLPVLLTSTASWFY